MIDDRQRREKNSPLKVGPNLGQTWTGLTAHWRSPRNFQLYMSTEGKNPPLKVGPNLHAGQDL